MAVTYLLFLTIVMVNFAAKDPPENDWDSFKKALNDFWLKVTRKCFSIITIVNNINSHQSFIIFVKQHGFNNINQLQTKKVNAIS